MSILSRLISRAATPPSLYDQSISYLNQPLPDISGIFSLPQASTPITTPEVAEQISNPAGLTLEQLRLLYQQYFGQQGGNGEGQDNTDYTNRVDNNAGIYSFKDLKNYVSALPTAAKVGGILAGPFGFAAGLFGTSIADKMGLTQKGRNQKAIEEARARGELKQNMAEARAITERLSQQVTSNRDQYRGGDGGGSTQGQREAGPGFSGSGSAAEMGSF